MEIALSHLFHSLNIHCIKRWSIDIRLPTLHLSLLFFSYDIKILFFLKKKKEKMNNHTCVALTDSSESVLPLLIPFWKSKTVNRTHSRADVPAQRNTSGLRLYKRETDSRREMNRDKRTSDDDVGVDRTTEQPLLRGPLRGRASRVKMTTTSLLPERPSAVQGHRRSQLRVAVRRCVSVSTRSLAHIAHSVARPIRKLLANALRDATQRMCVAYDDDILFPRAKR